MKILQSDIFLLPNGPQEAMCVTTNGIIRKDGRAVMGRGIALTADRRFGLAKDLAAKLKAGGNHVYDMGLRTDAQTGRVVRVITFPTKHDWKDSSDLALIVQSARELVDLCSREEITACYLTRPGCANGRLDWDTVRAAIEPLLDDRFIIADLAL